MSSRSFSSERLPQTGSTLAASTQASWRGTTKATALEEQPLGQHEAARNSATMTTWPTDCFVAIARARTAVHVGELGPSRGRRSEPNSSRGTPPSYRLEGRSQLPMKPMCSKSMGRAVELRRHTQRRRRRRRRRRWSPCNSKIGWCGGAVEPPGLNQHVEQICQNMTKVNMQMLKEFESLKNISK